MDNTHDGSIAARLRGVRASLPERVRLVAVSKFHPVEALREAYDAGQRIFGESRAQELAAKAAVLPDDIDWHFIGHLQTNKVRPVVAAATVIQSVDSLRLLRAIDAEARRAGRCIDVLLQVHVAREETKFGFDPDELPAAATEALTLDGVRVTGIMGMASNTDDTDRVADDFRRIRAAFDDLAAGAMAANDSFRTVSMGMSHDRDIAVSCGSTMVRVGTDIFGEREY